MMHPALIAALPCPALDKTQQATISRHVRQGMASREQADAAEAEAVRIIEQEVLPPWLA